MKHVPVVAVSILGLLGGCASPGSNKGPMPDSAAPKDSAPQDAATPDQGSGGAGGEAGTPDAPMVVCPMEPPNADMLPFAVDVGAKFVPSGYEGDATGNAISMPTTAGDPTCSGMRSGPGALGTCHTVIYTPLAPGTPIGYPPGATSEGWAAVVWQHPANNWGTKPGYRIPPGATKVSFWAKGAAGGETLKFFVGGTGFGSAPSAAAPCADPLSDSTLTLKLTSAWAQYTITLSGADYASGVLTGFGFAVAAADQPSSGGGVPDAGAGDAKGGGPPLTFYVDDIQWQK